MQYQLALADSDAFWVVPGSHRRPLTPAESAVIRGRPVTLSL